MCSLGTAVNTPATMKNVYSSTGEKHKATHVTSLNGSVTGKTMQQYHGNVIYRDGKELITANGLNEYDFGARQYYTAVPGFTRIDTLCEEYRHLSPYLYCTNNPVNLVDRDGKEPTKYEAALMAGCVYNDKEFDNYYDLLQNEKWTLSDKVSSIQYNYTGFGQNG